MESLDLVYSALTKLEQNYSKSKKTRREYITEKLGGDINVGSFLILHALSKEELTNPEDVEKLSVVREILSQIKERQNDLDSLTSFNFDSADDVNALLESFDKAQYQGTGISAVNQRDMWRSPDHPAHHSVNMHMSQVVPLLTAPYIHCYSEAIAKVVTAASGMSVKAGQIVQCKLGGRYEKVVAPDCWK